MVPVGTFLPDLCIDDPGQERLQILKLLIRLGDALPLLMEQILQLGRLLKAAFGELRCRLGDGVLGPLLQCRQ